MQEQSGTNADNILRNSQEVSTNMNGQQEGLMPTDPFHSPWTDSQIRIFLLEWEVVEQQVGHPGKKIYEKTSLLCQRLYQLGLCKSWQSCFNLMLSLQNLHRSLCAERSRADPLFSPYAESLYRILGYRPQESYFPACNQLPPEYRQAPAELTFPQYQHWYQGFSPFSGYFPGNPSQLMPSTSVTGSLPGVFGSQFPSGVSHGGFPPVFLDTQQQPWSPSDNDQGLH